MPAMQLPDPEALLSDITTKIIAQWQPDSALVGIQTGGVWIMQRIVNTLEAALKQPVDFGSLDAAFYRDDYAQRGLKNAPKPANIPFNIQDRHIILIDDIFYTGRTTRAVMNELFDYGRPASIQLAVLINRGGAQLPIKPQIVGAELQLKPHENLQLTQDTQGKLHLALKTQTDD